MRAIVLDGNENQAVAATRSLSRAGYDVTVGASESWSKAGWSRHAHRSLVYPSPRADVDGFLSALEMELRAYGPAVVLPMTERSTIPISKARDRIAAAGGLLVLPSHEALLRVFDKSCMTKLAASLGIAVPRTWVLETNDDEQSLARDLPFPVVLKPRVSEEQAETGGTAATGAPLYARDANEFTVALASLRSRCNSVLVQEFVVGTGAGYFALMRFGELRGEFAHRRIRDVRPTGSGSALRESVVASSDTRAASIALLKAVAWHGVAMVEFRLRPDGVPVFIEVNGRFWNSLALAIHSGVNFPLGLARIAEFGDVATLSTARIGVRCRWLLGDVRHLLSVWRGAPRGFPGRFPSRLETTFAVLRPKRGTMHDNFSLDDPLPELGDWLHFLGRRVPGALKQRMRGHRDA